MRKSLDEEWADAVDTLCVELDEFELLSAQCHETLNGATAEIVRLKTQLLDAKRNEERAVAELESSSNAIRAHCDLKSVPYSECHQCGRIELNPHPAYECPRCEVKEEQVADEARLDAAEAKLNTLEAAVRAVRDDEHIEWYHDLHPDQALSKLYALVSDGSEGGS